MRVQYHIPINAYVLATVGTFRQGLTEALSRFRCTAMFYYDDTHTYTHNMSQLMSNTRPTQNHKSQHVRESVRVPLACSHAASGTSILSTSPNDTTAWSWASQRRRGDRYVYIRHTINAPQISLWGWSLSTLNMFLYCCACGDREAKEETSSFFYQFAWVTSRHCACLQSCPGVSARFPDGLLAVLQSRLPSAEKWTWTPPCDCQEINWRKHLPGRRECLSQRVCLCLCAPPIPNTHLPPRFWDEIWEETDRFPSVLPIWKKGKEKKKPSCDSNICFSHLSLSLSSLPLLAIQVASADDQGMGSLRGRGGSGGGEKKRGGTEGKKEKEGASASHFTFPQHHPCVPASLQSVLLWAFHSTMAQGEEKKSIHISIIHTPVCLHVFASLPPSLSFPLFSVSPSQSLPWGRLTPPPRSYGLQMSLRRATITAQTKGGLALSSESLCGDCWLLLPYAGQLGPQKRDGDCGYTGATHKGGEES